MIEINLEKINSSINRKDLNYLIGLIFELTESSDKTDEKFKNKYVVKPVIKTIKPEKNLKKGREDDLKGVKENSKSPKRRKQKFEKLTIEQINLDSNYFCQYLVSLANDSFEWKKSKPPFDCHSDLLRQYLKKVHNLNRFDNNLNQAQPTLKFIAIDANLSTRKDEKFDPYFKVYAPDNKPTKKLVYKSRSFNNQNKPKWDEFFYVPVKRKNIVDKEKIRIELWDKDPSTLCGACKEFTKVRSCLRFKKTFKDFFEVLFSSCTTVDDLIGFCSVDLDEIPPTGIKLTKNILDKNSNEKGTIRMNLDWGSSKIKDKKDKLISILMHMKFYSFCFDSHLEKERLDSIPELKIEKINHLFLFYKTELTLINLNRIRGCLSDYEDGVIRRAVLIRTILKLQNEEMNCRLLLSSMLVNEDLSRPESLIWIKSDYLKELREFEKHNLNYLVEFYTTRFEAFKCLCFSKEFDCETLDILQFLRIMVKFEKFFPEDKFDEKINLELKNYIMFDLINKMLVDPNEWTQLANRLDFLDENLEKYWQRNIRAVLQKDGVEQVRSQYEKIVYKLIKKKINEWSCSRGKDESKKFRTVDNQLITYYFFCKNFEFIMFEDNDPAIRKASESKNLREINDLNEGLKMDAKSSSSLKVRIDQTSNEFIDDLRRDSKTGMPVIHDSQMSIVMSKEDEEKILIDINNLAFSDLVQFRTINPNLKNVFPKHLFSSWMDDRVDNCMRLSDKIVNEEIRKLMKIVDKVDVKDIKKSYSTVEKYFFETLVETVYFYTSLECWDEQLFERTIDKFCECLQVYVKNYNQCLISKQKLLKSKKFNRLIVISINELSRLNDKLLNRILIQILTNLPADEVWNCIDNFKEMIKRKKEKSKNVSKNKRSKDEKSKEEKSKEEKSKDEKSKDDALNKDGNKSNEELLESLNSPSSKLIIKICSRIRHTSDQIYQVINDLVNDLGKKILKQFEYSLNEIINSSKHNLMVKVVGQFEQNLVRFSECFTHNQIYIDLILFIKHNLNLNMRIIFVQFMYQYTKEKKNQKANKHLTKIKILKLVTITMKIKDFFLNPKSFKFDDKTRKLLHPFLTNFFIDSEEFRKLASKLDFY